jgi:quercetin dioxygenase-like cupin family protein
MICKALCRIRRRPAVLQRRNRNNPWSINSMIRCVRLWTGDDGESHFEEGWIDLPTSSRGDAVSPVAAALSVSFRETHKGGAFDWHDAPARQLVLTLCGVLEFEIRGGQRFTLGAGDVLLAEDTTGGGHRWHAVGDIPWRRAYIILADGATVPFVPGKRNS